MPSLDAGASVSRRLALPVVAIAIAIGACGTDDGDGAAAGRALRADAERRTSEAKAQGQKALKEHRERQAASAPTAEEEDAKEVTVRFYDILGEDQSSNEKRTTINAPAFCDLMSAKARAQTIHYARVSSGIARKWDCEAAVEQLVVSSKRTGGFEQTAKAEVIGVNAVGDRATATVRFGRWVTSIPLVREEGEWKLAQSEVSD